MISVITTEDVIGLVFLFAYGALMFICYVNWIKGDEEELLKEVQFDCPEGQMELQGRKGIVMKISYDEEGKCTRANGCVINCKLKRPQRG